MPACSSSGSVGRLADVDIHHIREPRTFDVAACYLCMGRVRVQCCLRPLRDFLYSVASRKDACLLIEMAKAAAQEFRKKTIQTIS